MFKKVKGTKDYSPVELFMRNVVTSIFVYKVRKSGFLEIETPIIEPLELFKRSSEQSEIVKKEMFEFSDKANRNLVLRPEGTASFIRAYVENKWFSLPNQKFYYYGPMFRYEQPQKGRYRQFYQAGIEIVGEKNYLKDVEAIYLGATILLELELPYILKINSIGDEASRAKYQEDLKKYLLPFKDQLSDISKERLDSGKVLRILDDKVDSKLDFMKNAPKISDYLSEESKTYFNNVQNSLDDLGIPFIVSNDLVRGLDYYDEIVFEFVYDTNNKSSQSTIIGGGRYSSLISDLGGPNLSSVGFGLGIDRLVDYLTSLEIFEKDFFEHSVNSFDIYIASTMNEENVNILFKKFYTPLIDISGIDLYFEYDVIKSNKAYERAKKYQAKIMISDDVKYKDLFFAKNLITNEKIYFAKNEEGLRTLFEFFLECEELDRINEEELYDLIEGDEDE
ncbi:histidine--tRNA ligase [Mycoplasmopsis cynos]|uniref:Histidine--tRNA ligase n=1 Tax=Mycoplasmopsis cynos (strain C142) TaxID=1246955 RepID=L0RW48_MYCC1|nr:histidine--tRNA ligase [Mycoplasmopsis cynos]CCP23856.1 Histidyl-tRNA synthetase [Mycoplasmopsis cynos C142]